MLCGVPFHFLQITILTEIVQCVGPFENALVTIVFIILQCLLNILSATLMTMEQPPYFTFAQRTEQPRILTNSFYNLGL